MKPATRQIVFGLALACGLFVTGCTHHIGPKTIPVDRFDYSTSIADSWKQQTLLNIVKMRYMDLPIFLDVSSIVSGYSLQTGVNIGGTVSSSKAVQGNFVTAGAQAVYTDRPTITYTPMTGEKFLRGMVTPIDPKSIFSMIQSGYAADFILPLTVESLNGVRNRSATGGAAREADSDFIRAMELLREVQAAGAVGMRVEEDKAKGKTGVMFFRNTNLSPALAAKAAEVRRLLRLPPAGQKFTLVYSPMPGGPGELAVNSRSMMQIMSAFASFIDVPAEHLQDQSALSLPGLNAPAEEGASRGVRIRSGKEKPEYSYAAVHYRDYWFWIDDRDWRSKRALTAIMFFFTLADTGGAEKVPIVTIPAQ